MENKYIEPDFWIDDEVYFIVKANHEFDEESECPYCDHGDMISKTDGSTIECPFCINGIQHRTIIKHGYYVEKGFIVSVTGRVLKGNANDDVTSIIYEIKNSVSIFCNCAQKHVFRNKEDAENKLENTLLNDPKGFKIVK